MFGADRTAPLGETSTRKGRVHRLNTYEIIVLALLLLSMIGIGITDFSPAHSHWYWLVMVPVFGAACIFIEWSRIRGHQFSWKTLLETQVLHWAGTLVAVQLAYLLLHAGRLDSENTGLVILLVLALATFLAGIHIGWHLSLVGIFLGLALATVAYLEALIWVLVFVFAGIATVYVLVKRKARQPRNVKNA